MGGSIKIVCITHTHTISELNKLIKNINDKEETN